jgi:hypothetical protein
MTHRPRHRSRATLAIVWIAVALASASTGACARHTKELQVSPPLPPAEEPPDDTKGAYVGDAGAPPT